MDNGDGATFEVWARISARHKTLLRTTVSYVLAMDICRRHRCSCYVKRSGFVIYDNGRPLPAELMHRPFEALRAGVDTGALRAARWPMPRNGRD